jgi:uncharacterized phiE125 gp8 family phage protein
VIAAERIHFALGAVSTGGTTEEPVSLTEAKELLRIETAEPTDDAFILRLIPAARKRLEDDYGQSFLVKQYDYAVDRPPASRILQIPIGPLRAIVSITGYDRDHVPTVVSSSDYYVDTLSRPGRVVLNDDASWPSDLRDANGIVVRFEAGHSTAASGVPDPAKLAILQLVAFLFEHRGEAAGAFTRPPIIDELMAEYLLGDEAG